MSKIGKISASAALLLGLAGTAFAGPQITFGPNDEGVMQIDYKGQFQMTARDTGSGDNNEDNTANFNFRRNRLAFMGKYGEMVGLYVQTEFTENPNVTTLGVASANQGSEFQLLDAVMRFDVNNAFKVNVGKFKYNLSRENLEACEMPLTLDRSLFIRTAYTTTRDSGVAIWGNLFNDVFQYRADVMEGRQAVSGDTAPSSSFRYSARGHVTLLDPESDYGYKGTYLGKKKVLTFGAAYQFEPEVAYGNTLAKTDKKDYKAWTVDAFFEYPLAGLGTITASTAYEDVNLDDAYKGANPDAGTIGINGEKNGWYVKGGYMLPTVPLQFFGRYEKWQFASLNNIIDQKIDWYGGGANYYFRDQNLKLTAEISHTAFDKEGFASGVTSKDFTTFITQLQLIF
ncbi:MAG: selenite/tellurite reduction operon porin ExtI [Desulfuromonadaceae bacterium]|nr:selenite/tellurite reduction operon porin ExtI [Desulfuromonadaceae bacterium]MDD2848785.1 selenite/tellurite reduction operon porin ExtI [Desulfuromonadaceae bacterium]MDD4130435.1 selenite/tellurite reduction operon porin ExtI [Desulfuromonadaceae bacterium]